MTLPGKAVTGEAVLLLMLTLTGSLGAQIRCLSYKESTAGPAATAFADPSVCELRLKGTGRDALEISIEVVGATSGDNVSIHPTAGIVSPAILHTDKNGRATFWWRGGVAGNTPVTIDLLHKSWRQVLRISHPSAKRVSGLQIAKRKRSGDKQAWFVGAQLKKPLRVTIPQLNRPADRSACEKSVVVFRPFGGGSVAPDSARATYDRDAQACTAAARWTLGDAVGQQSTVAQLVNGGTGSRQIFTATARQPARLAVGFSITFFQTDFDEIQSTTRSVKTTRVDSSGTTIEETLTMTETDSVPKRDPRGVDFDPIVGVDFPLVPSWGGVRLFTGVSIKEPTRFVYVSFSILQPFFTTLMEATAVDLRLGFRFARRTIALSGSDCDNGESLCKGDRIHVDGPTLLVSVDGTKIIGTILGSVF